MPRSPLRSLSRALPAVLCLTLAAHPALALRLVNHNILNYPGTTGPARDPLYRTILQPLSPDIFVAEEMTSQAGCTEFLGSLNTMEPGQWDGAPFVDGNDTDSGLFFKPSKVTFLGQWAFYPNAASLLRYVHVYRMRVVGYSGQGGEFRIYSLHLKASTGFEAQRLAEATGLRDSLNALPPGVPALVCGDYNFYTGLEPAMQKLIESQTNNTGRLYDPLGLQNIAWQDNTVMQSAWTQSPCKTGDTGCAPGASTGGLDDRFDLILPTTNWQDGAGFELVPGSYISVGNDGLHHNNSIQDPPTIPEGAAYASALHSVSDHLPVRVDLRVPALLGVPTAPIAFGRVLVGATATTSVTVSDPAPIPGESLTYTWSAPTGFTAPAGAQTVAAGANRADAIALATGVAGNFAGNLSLTSNAIESPSRTIAVSGTVLAHADPSLDSLASVTSSTIDFGTQPSGSFTPALVRVHDRGWSTLRAGLRITSAAITGGAGRFSLTGATPPLVTGTAAGYTVAFDGTGATTDSTYTATLSFATADEALPGATAAATLSVALQARVQASTTDAGPPRPRITALLAPTPNPLATGTTLRFDLAQAGDTRLDIFDASGRRVASLLHATLEPGRFTVAWNGHRDGGTPLGAGLYFARLLGPDGHAHTARLAIVR